MTQEEKIQIFIEQFNKDFGTDIKLEEKPFLIHLYQNYIKIHKSEKMNKKKLDGVLKFSEKINKNLHQEWQSQEFKEWNMLNDEINENWELQAFVYGFCISEQLKQESKVRSDKKVETDEMLEKLYYITREEKPTEKYKKYSNDYAIARDNLLKEIGKEYREKIEELSDIQNDMNNELSKQAFYNGFITAFKFFSFMPIKR